MTYLSCTPLLYLYNTWQQQTWRRTCARLSMFTSWSVNTARLWRVIQFLPALLWPTTNELNSISNRHKRSKLTSVTGAQQTLLTYILTTQVQGTRPACERDRWTMCNLYLKVKWSRWLNKIFSESVLCFISKMSTHHVTGNFLSNYKYSSSSCRPSCTYKY